VWAGRTHKYNPTQKEERGDAHRPWPFRLSRVFHVTGFFFQERVTAHTLRLVDSASGVPNRAIGETRFSGSVVWGAYRFFSRWRGARILESSVALPQNTLAAWRLGRRPPRSTRRCCPAGPWAVQPHARQSVLIWSHSWQQVRGRSGGGGSCNEWPQAQRDAPSRGALRSTVEARICGIHCRRNRGTCTRA
jgi:hypothetical protein